jgi:hypothetical protein
MLNACYQGHSSPQVVSAPSAGVPAARLRVAMEARSSEGFPEFIPSTSRVSTRRHHFDESPALTAVLQAQTGWDCSSEAQQRAVRRTLRRRERGAVSVRQRRLRNLPRVRGLRAGNRLGTLVVAAAERERCAGDCGRDPERPHGMTLLPSPCATLAWRSRRAHAVSGCQSSRGETST